MRDYEEITEFLGQTGPYFWKTFLMLNLLSLCNGYSGMYIVFVGASSNHRCRIPENANITDAWRRASIPTDMVNGELQDSRCSRYSLAEVSKLSTFNTSPVEVNLTDIPQESCVDGWVYDRSTFYSTIITEWDLVCDNEWKVPFTTSTFFIGYLCGSFVSGHLSDRFGRKPVLCSTATAQFLFIFLQAFCPSWELFCVAFFCVGFSQVSMVLSAFVLGTEMLSQTLRVLYVTLSHFLSYCIGYMLLPPIAFGLRHWRTLLLALSGPSILYLVPLWWVIAESPRWLVSQGRVQEAEDILRHAAHMNGVTPPNPIFEESEMENVTSKKDQKHTVLDVLRNRNIRDITVMCILLWVSSNIGYFGLSLNTSNLSGNPYLNCFLSALTEVPAYLTTAVVLKRFPRRLLLSVFLFIGGAVLFFIQLIPENLLGLAIFLEMVGKFCFAAFIAVVYAYTAEVYPTVLRNVGFGLCSSAARLGSITAPYVLYLGSYSPFLPYVVMGSFTLGSCTVNLFLPETLNRKLPETVDQMQKCRNYGEDVHTSDKFTHRFCTKDDGNDEQKNGTQFRPEVILENK